MEFIEITDTEIIFRAHYEPGVGAFPEIRGLIQSIERDEKRVKSVDFVVASTGVPLYAGELAFYRYERRKALLPRSVYLYACVGNTCRMELVGS